MDWLIFVGAILALAALAVVGQLRGWVDFSDKRTSGGSGSGGAMLVGDEIFNPARYEAQLELDRQTLLPAPAPVAGDDDRGIYDGRVTIDLSRR